MRDDSLGLFWQDVPEVRRGGARGPRQRGPMPQIPETGWTPPTEFPNLSASRIIGLDTETWDPELIESGPGWGRGKGHIVGVSLSADDGTSWYFPMRHGLELHEGEWRQVLPPNEAAMNMDPDTVLRYLDHTLHTNTPKVGANLGYDLGWLQWEGVRVGGPLFDIQYAAALLNSEAPSVDLDTLGEVYLGKGKETNLLYQFLADWCGGKPNDKQRKWLSISPPSLAGHYAEGDASLPVAIMAKQWVELHEKGVLELFNIECKLIRLLVAMRMKGAPVNVAKAEQVYDEFGGKLETLSAQMESIAGRFVNPNAADSIAKAFDNIGLPHPTKIHKQKRTEVTTFDQARLSAVGHPLTESILEYRKLAKVRDVFIKSYIIDKHVNWRVFCSFHPLRGEGLGARSGRFSSSGPNLQNIPVRTEEGRLVREIFDGTIFGNRWRSFDYSSIEYRLLVHFAVGPGADEVRAQFLDNPDTDYHQFVMELIERMTGILLERTDVKRINFGIIYGMALNALATALELPRSKAQELLSTYHEAIPYARQTMDATAAEVHNNGFVRTILGRRSDFNAWGPKAFSADGRVSLPYNVAVHKYGMFNIERQHTHKALNRKLQGSAADVMKKAMVDCWESGLFAESACGVPILTVHDELDFEDKGDFDNPAWIELKYRMENCLEPGLLRVPLKVDGDYAENWAGAH